MIRNRFAAALVPALLLSGVPLIPRTAPQDPGDLVDELDQQDYEVGESPERYAQVKFVEGTVTVRKGEEDEPLTRGVPVAEGDVVESRGRGVLQLGDGSAVAFGAGTRFRVAALFSEQDQERRVLLVLERGELRVCRGAQSEAVIRVDTPSGSGSLGSRGASRPEATFQVSKDPRGDKVVFLVHGGQATWVNAEGQARVYAGQRLTVYGNDDVLDRVSDFNAYALGDFDQWAEALVRPRPSESAARVPPEIRYYADDLDGNGKWVYVEDTESWCWTPTAVDADWSPYSNGYWGAYGGGMTWVSSEPWGYVTCHHGRWGWRMGLGWYWIPGVYYSPAWVAWHSTGTWFGWSPLGFHNRPVQWRDRQRCWNVVDVHHVGDRNLRPWFHRDPAVVGVFNRPHAQGARPWFQGRIIVNRQELRDPARFQRVAGQPAVARERVQVYTRETGRTILRPPAPADRGGFNRMERPRPDAPRPVVRPGTGDRVRVEREDPPRTEINRREPIRQETPRTEINRREPVREQPRVETPRPEINRREPVREQPRPEVPRTEINKREPIREQPRPEAPGPERREAPRQEAPRMERRETPRPEAPSPERREAPRQEAPRMERREAPRPEAPRMERREAPRQESRPAPAPAPRPAPPPAPRAEPKPAPQEKK